MTIHRNLGSHSGTLISQWSKYLTTRVCVRGTLHVIAHNPRYLAGNRVEWQVSPWVQWRLGNAKDCRDGNRCRRGLTIGGLGTPCEDLA